jgi:hypothetical protein
MQEQLCQSGCRCRCSVRPASRSARLLSADAAGRWRETTGAPDPEHVADQHLQAAGRSRPRSRPGTRRAGTSTRTRLSGSGHPCAVGEPAGSRRLGAPGEHSFESPCGNCSRRTRRSSRAWGRRDHARRQSQDRPIARVHAAPCRSRQSCRRCPGSLRHQQASRTVSGDM